MQNYNQPTSTPVPKVAAVGVTGVIVTILVLVASVFHYTLPPDLTSNVTQLVAGVVALTSLLHFVVAYVKKDKKPAVAVPLIQNQTGVK